MSGGASARPMEDAGRATMLHLGLGAFHRAHQAAYLQLLHDAGDLRWTLVGGDIRPDERGIIDAIAAQGGCYTLETVDPRGQRRYQKIAAIARVLPYRGGAEEFVRVGALAATRIVSYTVTEAGYYLDASGALATSHPDVTSDLGRAASGARTLYGTLAAICAERMRLGTGPLTLLSCDNLRANGAQSRSGLLQFLALRGDRDLADWVRENTTSPNSMVDRITPRPPPELRARVHAATGIDDAVPVMAEAYLQWVIEDDFVGGRPAWERVGADLVRNVAPYEEAKIRILNGSHTALALAGLLRGHRYIHEAVRDHAVRATTVEYVTADVLPCLRPSPIDLESYRDRVLERFENAALGDTIERVAADSLAKLRAFIGPSLRDGLARGAAPTALSMVLAHYLEFLQRWREDRLTIEYRDAELELARSIATSADPALALCAAETLWGPSARDPRLATAVRNASRVAKAFANS